MEQRHADYIEYYRARMQKYANNPDYQNTFEAEKSLFDAVSTAASLEEFGERMKEGALNHQVAVALVKDEAKMRADFYLSLGETVRAGSHLEILDNIASTTYTDVQDLVTMVADVETRWQIKIAMDEYMIE